jgi:hypothetical protein
MENVALPQARRLRAGSIKERGLLTTLSSEAKLPKLPDALPARLSEGELKAARRLLCLRGYPA